MQLLFTLVAWIRSDHWQALLQELIDANKIKARSKWRQVYPTFASDERYLNLLGKPGSNPLELFWDIVDQLDQKLDAKIATAEECIRRVEVPNESPEDAAKVLVVTAQSTLEEFVERVRRDPESGRKLNEEDLQEVFRCVSFFASTYFCHSPIISCTTKPSRSSKTKNAVMNAGKDTSKMISATHSRNSPIPSISTYHTKL